MRTTLDLPDSTFRQLKSLAAKRGTAWYDQELLAALRPYLTLSPSFRAATGGAIDPNLFATIADAEVKLAREHAFLVVEKIDGLPDADSFWAERLDALTGLLKQVFDLYATVGEANAGFDPSAMQRPSIPPHAQNRHHAEWARLYDLIWRSWSAIEATDPPASRHWIERSTSRLDLDSSNKRSRESFDSPTRVARL